LFCAATLVVYVARALLIAFGGILLAIFLGFLADRLAELIQIRRGWAFAIVAVGISFLLGVAGWVAMPRVANQISDLIHALPQTIQTVRNDLSQREWGRTLLGYVPRLIASSGVTGNLTTLGSRLFEGLEDLVIIAVLGLYLGANPRPYFKGLLALFPKDDRDRGRDVLTEVAYTLRWWVIGQLIPMGVLGIVTGIGLYLLRVPLAFTLALFTGFMIFIPFVGSVIALVVTLIVAIPQGMPTVLYVTLLFLGVHSAEGYLLTPLVQRRAVHVPPALSIMSQVLMALLLGFFGLALATPLAAATLVVVEMLYLNQRPEHHGG
jgi:predicted PurR-regulated permease PerM